MRIAVVQLAYGDEESFAARVDRVAGLVAEQAGHDLVVLPELWGATGFGYRRWADEAQPLDGPWAGGDGGCRARGIRDPPRRVLRRAAARPRRRRARPREHLGRPRRRRRGARDLPQGAPVRVRGGRAPAHGGGRGRRRRRPACGRRPTGAHGAVDLLRPALPRDLPPSGGCRCRAVRRARRLAGGARRALVAAGAGAGDREPGVVVQCNTAGTHAGHEMGGRSQVVSATGEVLAEAPGPG